MKCNFWDWCCHLVKNFLLATITLEAVPFHVYALFSALLPLFNASWKSCSVRVFSTTCNSASITSIVSKWRLSVLSSIGETEVGWIEDDSHVVFGTKFLGDKGSVKKCAVFMQPPVLFSPKFRAKSSHIFIQSP
jgi:hypothetical protein